MSASIDTPADELATTLQTQAGLREHSDLRVLRVRGDDRLSWLNGQVTNDVRAITPGASVNALAVSVRGKILAELWISDFDAEMVVLVPASAAATLVENLERYIIMEDVTLELTSERVLSLEGPASAALSGKVADAPGVRGFAWDPLGVGGFVWIGDEVSVAALRARLQTWAPLVTEPVHELVRLRQARPRFGTDFDEHHYPQEAGLKALVSFQKGCYLGQEVVCTLENRGRLNRHLCLLRGPSGADFATFAIEVGSELNVAGSGDAAGSVTSASWDPQLGAARVLAYVRRVHAQVGASLRLGEQTLTIERLVGEADPATLST
jgi:folate-binding protein YgfZ